MMKIEQILFIYAEQKLQYKTSMARKPEEVKIEGRYNRERQPMLPINRSREAMAIVTASPAVKYVLV